MRKEKYSVDVYVCEKCGKEFAHESACKEHEAGCHKVVYYTATLFDMLGDSGESIINAEPPVTISIDCPFAKEKLNANAVSLKTTKFEMYFDVGKYTPEEASNIFTKAIIDWEVKRHEGFLKAISSVYQCLEKKDSKQGGIVCLR